MKTELKPKFIEELKNSGGIVCVACENTGIRRGTYDNWRREDGEFDEAVREVMEAQVDYVESKLMTLINAGDTTATVFYLKTRGKQRGWTERASSAGNIHVRIGGTDNVGVVGMIGGATARGAEGAEPPQNSREAANFGGSGGAIGEIGSGADVKKEIGKKVRGIKKALKEEGKYSKELNAQIELAAGLLVRTERIKAAMERPDYSPILVETSREGNERRSVNPMERLYLDYAQQSRRSLQALGMNVDSKERRTDQDSMGDFMEEFKRGEREDE